MLPAERRNTAMSEPMKPMEIEQRSFAIITELLGDRVLAPENELVIKRVIPVSYTHLTLPTTPYV